MKDISKDNLDSFMSYYQNFHDSVITSIEYDIINSKINLYINVFWSGKPSLKEDGSLETNKLNMKVVFDDIYQCNNKELYSWDSIYDAYLKFIKLDNVEYICFADAKENPNIYIVSKKMFYEIIYDIILLD